MPRSTKPKFYDLSYRTRRLQQSLAWVNGVSQHDPVDNECCPDFSCCHPDFFHTDPAKRAERHRQLMDMYRENPI
jgi:hypothetical protein